jgi:hypothetical protein
LKMKTVCFSETLVRTYKSKRRQNQQNRHTHVLIRYVFHAAYLFQHFWCIESFLRICVNSRCQVGVISGRYESKLKSCNSSYCLPGRKFNLKPFSHFENKICERTDTTSCVRFIYFV